MIIIETIMNKKKLISKGNKKKKLLKNNLSNSNSKCKAVWVQDKTYKEALS